MAHHERTWRLCAIRRGISSTDGDGNSRKDLAAGRGLRVSPRQDNGVQLRQCRKQGLPTDVQRCRPSTCSSVWIKVSGPNLECNGGDSGGPWFNGSIAYGIYKGQSSTGSTAAACNYAFYMAINYITGMNVTVLIG